MIGLTIVFSCVVAEVCPAKKKKIDWEVICFCGEKLELDWYLGVSYK